MLTSIDPNTGRTIATYETMSPSEVDGCLDRSEDARLRRRHAALEHAPAAYDPGAWADAAMTAIQIATGAPASQA